MRNPETFAAFLERKRAEHGAKFDPSDLAPAFIQYFESQERIEVVNKGFGYRRRGRVGVTSGWKPAFLLIHRVSDWGSSDVLGAGDEVVKVIAPYQVSI